MLNGLPIESPSWHQYAVSIVCRVRLKTTIGHASDTIPNAIKHFPSTPQRNSKISLFLNHIRGFCF